MAQREETFTVTVTVPASVMITTRDSGDFMFDFARVAEDRRAAFVADAFQVGVQKTAVDAASGAKAFAEDKDSPVNDTVEARKILIGKRLNAWYESGEFGARAGSVSISGQGSAVDYEYLAYFQSAIADKIGKKEWAKLDAKERRQAALDAIGAQDADTIKALLPEMQRRADEREEARKEKARRDAESAERLASVKIKL